LLFRKLKLPLFGWANEASLARKNSRKEESHKLIIRKEAKAKIDYLNSILANGINKL